MPEELKRLLGRRRPGGAGRDGPANGDSGARRLRRLPPPPPAPTRRGPSRWRPQRPPSPSGRWTSAGAATAGEVEAESKAQVTEQLRQRGLIVLDVSEKSEPFKIEDLFKRWKGVDMRELAVFSRQFATLVASGMPMLRTLHTLEEQTQDEMIKEAVAGLRADVEAGSTLEQAMERHPEVFDRLFRAMVRSGEQSGRLEDALDRIAFQVEKTDALRRQVKSALMYPALVFGFAMVVLVAIVAFVIPVFVGIFEEIAEENPAKRPRCRCRRRSASRPPTR